MGTIKKDAIRADNDTIDVTAEQLAEAFRRIKDPEVRASIVALVTRLAETSRDPGGYGHA